MLRCSAWMCRLNLAEPCLIKSKDLGSNFGSSKFSYSSPILFLFFSYSALPWAPIREVQVTRFGRTISSRPPFSPNSQTLNPNPDLNGLGKPQDELNPMQAPTRGVQVATLGPHDWAALLPPPQRHPGGAPHGSDIFLKPFFSNI